MGQAVTKLVESFENEPEKEKLANDSLNSLVDSADLRTELFFSKILNEAEHIKDIPIDRVLRRDHLTHALVSEEPSDVGGVIKDNFESFASGDIAAGISKLLNNGLKVLLGSYNGNTAKRETYVITTGPLGGITRIDMSFYAYRFTSDQITSTVKQVISVSLVVSSVDSSKLDDSTLRNIVQLVYGSLEIEDQKKILGQLKDAIKDEVPKASISDKVPRSIS